jgi:hypothetical protein
LVSVKVGAAAVVGDEVDLIEAERVAEGLQHRGLRAERDVLARLRRAVAVRDEVDRETAAHAGDAVDHMTPQIGVEKHAVHKQGGRSCPSFDIGDFADRGGHAFLFDCHGKSLP